MDRWVQEHLICPRDYGNLLLERETLVCQQGHTYPYIDGVPIMLLKEAEPTHGELSRALDRAEIAYELARAERDAKGNQHGVDLLVESVIGATSGHLYGPLIGKLPRYPIPELRLPPGSGQTFLDIGCNWGRWTISAARKGYSTVGIDPSFGGILAARRVSRQLGVSSRFVVADARYLPFKPESFDFIFSYSVFQHFGKRDVKSSLTEVARVLKLSGTSLIQMPNKYGVRCLYHQMKRGFREAMTFEVRYWKPSELTRIFSNTIGPTSMIVDGYFGLGMVANDLDLLSIRHRLVVHSSEALRKMSEKLSWMAYLADSLYLKSTRK